MKATIHKVTVHLADMDRQLYGDYDVTIARHPSETDERLLVRLLAFALNIPADNDLGYLEFAKDMWDPDEPALWQKDFTGRIQHWIEIGQPDEKRLLRVSARVERVSVYSYSSSTAIWWKALEPRITRIRNLTIWEVPEGQAEALVGLAQRSMELDVTVQDGDIWIGDGKHSFQVQPAVLYKGG